MIFTGDIIIYKSVSNIVLYEDKIYNLYTDNIGVKKIITGDVK